MSFQASGEICRKVAIEVLLKVLIIAAWVSASSDFIDRKRYSSLPHEEYIQNVNRSIDQINEKYGFNHKRNQRKSRVKANFSTIDEDFKKLLHRDSKFAKIWKNEEKHERELLGEKYLIKKMNMSLEDREFEVYKKFVNWVLVLTTDPYMVSKKEQSTIRSPVDHSDFIKI